ncbi:hypothetical protein DsansV1_C09g0089441 [Dioscorea sansibarensis]
MIIIAAQTSRLRIVRPIVRIRRYRRIALCFSTLMESIGGDDRTADIRSGTSVRIEEVSDSELKEMKTSNKVWLETRTLAFL